MNRYVTNEPDILWSPVPIADGGTGQITAALAINALVPSQASASGKVLTSNGSVVSWETPSAGSSIKVATIKDQKSNGTNGGSNSVTAYTAVRELNTISDPQTIGVTLDSNAFELPAGTYYISAVAPFFETADTSIAIWNATANTPVPGGYGQNGYSQSSSVVGINVSATALITIAVPTEFEIRYHCGAVQADNGLGVTSTDANATDHVEVYTSVVVMKL